MHFFRNRNRPRSSFDIQVGRFHLLEITVHLVAHRRNSSHRKSLERKKSREANGETVDEDEWEWYDNNREDINAEFLELLEASILSRMFGKELEDFHRATNPSILEQENEDIGGIASKNKNGNKRKRKGNTANSRKQNNKTKHRGLAGIAEEDEGDQKPEKDIYFAFGELIQLAYKKEPIRDDRSSRTIIFRSNHQEKKDSTGKGVKKANTNSAHQNSSFQSRLKLSHRLLVWISKSDAAAAASEGGLETKAASRPGEGMYRSEMIPISSLFRKPKELMDFSDDEDD